MTIKEIGCCGSYCKTCREFTSGNCRGCKLGYENGERDIRRAKCKIKLCCFRDRKLETCADCDEYLVCEIIQGWFSNNGYQYKKNQESIEYIREFGYDQFIEKADKWKNLYGKLD